MLDLFIFVLKQLNSNCNILFLIQESENPIRICCVLVPTEAKLGSYTTNPFQFDRKWTIEDAAFSGESYSSQNENSILRDELSDLKRLIAELSHSVIQQRNTESVNVVPSAPSAPSAPSEPSTSKKGGRPPRKVKGKAPASAPTAPAPAPAPRRKSFIGGLFSSSIINADPDYEPDDEEEDEEEESIHSGRSAYSSFAPRTPALPPPFRPIRSTPSVRYVTSLQLEING